MSNPHYPKWLFSATEPFKTIAQDRESELDLLQEGWRDTPFSEEEIKEAAKSIKKEEPGLEQFNPPIQLKDPVGVDLTFTTEELTKPIDEELKKLLPPPGPDSPAGAVGALGPGPDPVGQAGPVGEPGQAPVAPTSDPKKTDWNKKLSKEVKKASEELI